MTNTTRPVFFLAALLALAFGGMPTAAQEPALKLAPKRLDAFGDPLPRGVLARLGTTRLRHSAAIQALAFSPDGRVLVAGSVNGTIRFHEVATGKTLRTCGDVGHQLQAVAFAPDGKTVVSAGWHGDLFVWHTASGRLLSKLGDPNRWNTNGLRFSGDGKHLLTSDANGHISSWEVATGKLRHTFLVQLDNWFRIAFSADGKLASSAGGDHVVRLWEVATGKEVLKLPAHKSNVYAAVFSPDGRYLATGGGSNNLHLWELATGQLVYVLPTQASILAFSPDGRTLASAGNYGYGGITLWDLATGKERHKLLEHETAVGALAFSPDGKTLASAGAGGVIRLWDAATGKGKVTLPGFEGGPVPLRFLPDGRTLALQTPARMHFWDTGPSRAEGKALSVLAGRHARASRLSGVLSPDGKLLAASSSYRGVYVYDIAEGTERFHLAPNQEVTGVAFAPDGKAIATASYGTITVWDAGTRKALRRLEGHKASRAHRLAYTADGRTLISVGSDAVCFWDAATGKERRRAPFPVDPRDPGSSYDIPSLIVSPTGRTLAVGGRSRGLVLWDVATGRSVQALSTSGACAFSPDGRILALGGAGSTVELWEVATGQRFAMLSGHEGAIRGVAFTPDGRTLASGSSDNTILLWDVRPGHVLNRDKPGAQRGDADLAGCWKALAEGDAEAGQQAVGRLALDPARSVPFLGKRLRPAAAVSAECLRSLITGLDAREFAVREKALRALKQMGPLAEQAVREALKGNPSLEVRRRLESLLAGLGSPEVRVAPGDGLRSVRALQVLEAVGTPAARAVLERMAKGAPEAAATQDARAALGRLARRSAELHGN